MGRFPEMYNDPKCHRINESKGGKKRGREPGHPPQFSLCFSLLCTTPYYLKVWNRLHVVTQ